MDRIDKLCAYLTPCETFADIGCDHGYCTEYMLKHNLCKRAVISDISPKSLAKAQTLLASYIAAGRVDAVACFGLEKIPNTVNEVLIAGMGGEEIVAILKQGFIPERFVFQPMKNADKLRAFLLQNGCCIERDDLFFSGKYYFCISGTRHGEQAPYTPTQLLFGKDSLKTQVFKNYIAAEIAKKERYLQTQMNEQNRAAVQAELDYLKGVQCDDIT